VVAVVEPTLYFPSIEALNRSAAEEEEEEEEDDEEEDEDEEEFV
jgi:hypothetical protein